MPAHRILSLHRQRISAIARQIIATLETMRLKHHCLRVIDPPDASGPLSGDQTTDRIVAWTTNAAWIQISARTV